MKVLVTGAGGFLGWRFATLFRQRGHEVVALARRGSERSYAAGLDPVRMDAGDVEARGLLAGCDAVLHFAGVPDPTKARSDPARAVRENAGTTLNLLEGCLEHGCGLVYPSTVRAAVQPPPDEYALSKRLGELTCSLHPAPATVVRFTSVFGPGQVASEGATGAIASFAARALAGEPLVVLGDPERTRDFLYVDDAAGAVETIVADGRWDETVTVGSGEPTSLLRAAELVREAAGTQAPIETPRNELPAGENESYGAGERLDVPVRPLEEAIQAYVDWLKAHSLS